MRTRRIGLVSLALVLAACGGGESAAGGDADGPAVGVADSAMGEILVDADGMTLYVFTVDTPGTSNCTGECADAWPPVSGDTRVGAVIDPSLVSTIERSDGTTQLAIGGFPLYRFGGDSSPGDTDGHGLQDVWFVVDPSGEPVGKSPSSGGVYDY